MKETHELSERDFKRAIRASCRRKLIEGNFESGEDVSALRRFVGLSRKAFAKALGISIDALRNWEQGRRTPQGPALALRERFHLTQADLARLLRLGPRFSSSSAADVL